MGVIAMPWAPPPANVIKVNFDVAIRDSFAVGAAIARNSDGQVLGAMVKRLEAMSPLEGEMEATLLGVQMASSHGFQTVFLEGDSETVIKAIKNWPHPVDWRISKMGKELHYVSGRLQCLQVFHVYRDANDKAHHLARWAAAKILLVSNPCKF